MLYCRVVREKFLPENKLMQVRSPNSALSTFILAKVSQKLNMGGTRLSKPAKHNVFRV